MKQRNLVLILIPIFILVVIWVASNVYHSYINSTISLPVAEQIIPIDGTFDTKTIDQIKTRVRVNSTDQISAGTSGTLSPTPSLTPTPTINERNASSSAQTSPVPTRTL